MPAELQELYLVNTLERLTGIKGAFFEPALLTFRTAYIWEARLRKPAFSGLVLQNYASRI